MNTSAIDPALLAEARLARPRAVAIARSGTQSTDATWDQRLLFSKSKDSAKIIKHHENAVVILRYHPLWRGCIQFDEHSYRVIVTGAPWHESDSPQGHDDGWREWTDPDSSRLSSWLLREIHGLQLSVTDCERAVTIAAEANRIHPFRDYLDSLTWDGVSRLDHWLTCYLGVAPSHYASCVGRWWLTSAAARIYRPGVKADLVLVLEGDQGFQKSTALRTICGEQWFCDTPIDIGNKDAYMTLQGKVIVELPEFHSIKKADSDKAKSFFSSPYDDYRPPYGKRNVKVPRSCVFAATINPRGAYLTDPTGARRYVSVACGKTGPADIAGLAADRDQLWAEAAARYNAGERFYPHGAEEEAMCAAEGDERTEGEPWTEIIRDWLALHPGEVRIEEVLIGACAIDKGDINRSHQMRASGVLAELQYERKRQSPDSDGHRPWCYRRA